MNHEIDENYLQSPVRRWFRWRRRRDLFPVLEYVAEPLELRTPAEGDAYDFTVTVYRVWTDGGRSPDAVQRRFLDFEGQVNESIALTTRRVLRRYAPHRTDDAESDLNDQLDRLAREGLGDRWLRWSARAEVAAHDDVRAILRTAWTRQSEVTALHEYSEEIVKKYTDTIELWRKFLAGLGIGEFTGDQPAPFIAPHLVRLAADPGSAASIIQELAKRREEKDGELLSQVSEAVRNVDNADVNLFEYEVAQSSALSRLMEWAGLPVPRPGPAPTEGF
jgi:hypothetical protein